jgi:hypothetical protein
VTDLTEHAGVSTSLTIRKWDPDQTRWTLQRSGDWQSLAWLDLGADVAVPPELFKAYGVAPAETWHGEHLNNVLQAGWVALLGSIAGTSITNKFSAVYGRIGVGTSSAAVAYAQTALQGDSGGGSTTSYYQLVSGAPTISTGSSPPTLVLAATFGTAVANFAWAEFGTDNYTASSVTTSGTSSVFFNRGVAAMGTKASGATWAATETISFGYPSGAGTVT